MKKIIVSIIVTGLLLSMVSINTGTIEDGTTIYVDDDNTEGPWDGTEEHPFQHIQDGVNAADSGDTVFVCNGTYCEDVSIQKTMDLVGENRNNTIIDGVGSYKTVDITADWVNIGGFTIRNSSGLGAVGVYVNSNYATISGNILLDNPFGVKIASSSNTTVIGNNMTANGWRGVKVSDSSNTIISRNIISHNGKEGIWIDESSSNTIISGNIITNNSGGISIYHSSGNNITGNNITDSEFAGIFLKFLSNSVISGNIITDNLWDGIWLVESDNTVISDNFITNNHGGNNYYSSGIYHDLSSNTTITGNIIINNYNHGIVTQFSSNSYITGNTIADCDCFGIWLRYSSTNITISDNNITNNNYGIITVGDSSNNLLYHNNFIGNTKNAIDPYTNIWDDGYPSGGNYWDDYTGEDNDGDGIGDTPYDIPGGSNQDLYPLMEPRVTEPPYAPNIDGPTSGTSGEEYEYTFTATDPDDDDICLWIEWGDDTTEEWIGPYGSGEEVTISHTWDEEDDYTISAKAKDIHGAESDWAYLEVSMPLNQNLISKVSVAVMKSIQTMSSPTMNGMNLLR